MKCLHILFLVIFVIQTVNSKLEYGVMDTGNSQYCIGYLKNAPLTYKDDAIKYETIEPKPVRENFCSVGNRTVGVDTANKIVVVAYNYECNPNDVVKTAYNKKSAGVLFYNHNYKYTDLIVSPNSSFVIAFMDNKTYSSLTTESTVLLYRTSYLSQFDYSSIFLALIAISIVFFATLNNKSHEKVKPISEIETETTNSESTKPMLKNMTIVVAVLLVMLVVFVSSLYFAFNVAVVVCIVLFVIHSTYASYDILQAVVAEIFKQKYIEPKIVSMPFTTRNFELHKLFLFLLCCIMPLTWVCTRHSQSAWILQDILGYISCFYIIRRLIIPSVIYILVIFILFFLYDIFLVDVTRFFTTSGESVMEQIILGPSQSKNSGYDFVLDTKNLTNLESDYVLNTREMIPFIFKLPSLLLDTKSMAVCYGNYARIVILGFGDVVIPAFLTAYSRTYMQISKCTTPYFQISMICYVIGLIETFVVLQITKLGQPALLFIIPTMLIPFIIVACYKKDIKFMLKGYKIMQNTSQENQQINAPV